jgi:hypothetical protein
LSENFAILGKSILSQANPLTQNKMGKIFKFIGIFLIGITALTSCSSDSSSSNVDEDLLTDKWWYSADGTVSDVYFHSNGDYEQNFVWNGTNIASSGNWEWINQDAGTIHLYNLVGNAVTEAQLKVSELTAHTVKLKQSVDEGATWSAAASFIDTDN